MLKLLGLLGLGELHVWWFGGGGWRAPTGKGMDMWACR